MANGRLFWRQEIGAKREGNPRKSSFFKGRNLGYDDANSIYATKITLGRVSVKDPQGSIFRIYSVLLLLFLF